MLGAIVAAGDVSLWNDYDEMEMELVLHTGLLCSHPDPDQRPTMGQSLSYLKMEAPFPVHMLPRHKLRPRYSQTSLDRVSSSTVGITKFQDSESQARIRDEDDILPDRNDRGHQNG